MPLGPISGEGTSLTADELAAIQAADAPDADNPFATVGQIPSDELTADQLAAIQGANSPTGSNVFATMADIPSPAPGGSGQVVKHVLTNDNASSNGTTIIPLDDSVPQSGEGTEYGTFTYVPQTSGNDLWVRVSGYLTRSAVGTVIVALFKDSDTDAIAAQPILVANGNYTMTFSLMVSLTVNGTTTFSLRYGPQAAATAYINRNGTGDLLGAVSFVTWEAIEFTPNT